MFVDEIINLSNPLVLILILGLGPSKGSTDTGRISLRGSKDFRWAQSPRLKGYGMRAMGIAE